MTNEHKVEATQYLTHAIWQEADLATIYSGDIRQPWKSVHGFPTTAARLAVGHPLVLHCREDEVFDFMSRLNDLLANPESLNRAYGWLMALRQGIRKKVISLTEIEQKPITANESAGVLTAAEQILTQRSTQSKVDRLASILSPNHPVQELKGKIKMLIRLNVLTMALEQAKDRGFRVVVLDKRRKSVRSPGNPEYRAGLIPSQYHLTLWSYLVAHSNNGRSVI